MAIALQIHLQNKTNYLKVYDKSRQNRAIARHVSFFKTWFPQMKIQPMQKLGHSECLGRQAESGLI
jgi:hypothetical protein